jgi:hypothetical protein
MRLRGLGACGTIDLGRGHFREERLAPCHRSLIRSSGRSLTRSTTPCAWNRVNTIWGPILLGWTNDLTWTFSQIREGFQHHRLPWLTNKWQMRLPIREAVAIPTTPVEELGLEPRVAR